MALAKLRLSKTASNILFNKVGSSNLKLFFLTSHPMSMVVFMLPHLRALTPYWRLHVLANTKEARHRAGPARHQGPDGGPGR